MRTLAILLASVSAASAFSTAANAADPGIAEALRALPGYRLASTREKRRAAGIRPAVQLFADLDGLLSSTHPEAELVAYLSDAARLALENVAKLDLGFGIPSRGEAEAMARIVERLKKACGCRLGGATTGCGATPEDPRALVAEFRRHDRLLSDAIERAQVSEDPERRVEWALLAQLYHKAGAVAYDIGDRCAFPRQADGNYRAQPSARPEP